MDSKELEVLKELDGPSSLTQARAKRYVTDAAYRAEVDKADKLKGTKAGPELRATYFGEKPAAAPTPVAPPTAEQVAAAVKKYPQNRCVGLFKRPANEPGEVLSTLSKEDRDEAKLAAQFFGIVPSQGGSSVTFNYETSRDRAAKREARESASLAAERKQAEALPPGINRDAQGNIVLSDESAFSAWKKEKADHSAALAFLEDAAK